MFGSGLGVGPRSNLEFAVDSEQEEKYIDVCDLLVAAGYFRARISSLKAFDKIVGGLAWCIINSYVDIGDIEIFFDEEARLGDKLKTAEQVCKALVRMGCPHPLQAHQMQERRVDFINVYPVVRWLVRQVIDTREELGDSIRQYSETQFSKTYATPQDQLFQSRKENATVFVGSVIDTYKPKRSFKRSKALRSQEEKERVQATLLEYGHLFRQSREAPQETKQKKSGIASQLESKLGGSKSKPSSGSSGKTEDEMLDEKLSSDYASFQAGESISGTTLGSIVSKDRLSALAESYKAQREKDMEQVSKDPKLQGEALHRRQVEQKERQIAAEKLLWRL